MSATPKDSVLSLADFLLARLDEDEARWQAGKWTGGDEGTAAVAYGRAVRTCRALRRVVELHAVERVSVETFAVDMHRGVDSPPDPVRAPDEFACVTCGKVPAGSACDTLRALATIYADHRNYRAEAAS